MSPSTNIILFAKKNSLILGLHILIICNLCLSSSSKFAFSVEKILVLESISLSTLIIVVCGFETSINIGECVVIITCQFCISAILYRASLAALIAGGCKNDSGSSINNILGLSLFILVLPFL